MAKSKRTRLSVYSIYGLGFIVNTNELLVDQAGALIEKVRRYLVRLLVFPLDEDSQPPLGVCLLVCSSSS